MSLTITGLPQASDRAYETTYTAVVVDDATVVLDESYDTESARRDAVVSLLRSNHDEVDEADIEAILAPYGGASADEALEQVVSLYADFGVDVHLGEHLRDVGPAVFYSAFTDYGDGTHFAEHYGSRDERLKELRLRAANMSKGSPAEFFDNADELTCKQLLEFALTPTNGRVHLFEATREDVGGAYISRGKEG